jgi:hypothetical protein
MCQDNFKKRLKLWEESVQNTKAGIEAMLKGELPPRPKSMQPISALTEAPNYKPGEFLEHARQLFNKYQEDYGNPNPSS